MLRTCFSCCCINSGRHRRLYNGITDVDEEDYILPGGDIQWDRSTKSFVSRRTGGGLTESQYVPPQISRPCLPTIEQFNLLKTVGRGAFGKVLLTVHCSTRTLYAMKVVPKSKVAQQRQIRQILTEMQILRKVKHPFCVSLQFAFQNSGFLFYIFEFAAGGMLFYHLKEENRFSESKSRFYIGEIILALEYLHGLGVIFRDLKPENCMLSAIGHIVMTDFGSAKTLGDGEKTSTLAGTPQYMAPEVLKGEPYGYSADWWCCGILLYEMLTGKTPFQSHDRVELYRAVLRGQFKIPFYISPRGRSLLYRLIERDPDIRLGGNDDTSSESAQEIKQHPFFSDIPLDPQEENQYLIEETERQRHQQALENTTASVSSSILTPGHIVRRLSHSAARFTGSFSMQGSPCEWSWDQLLAGAVTPPFTPKLAHPTDCSYFNPVMTALPPTLNDLETSGTDGYIDGFDYAGRNADYDAVLTDTHHDPNTMTVLAEVHD